MSSACLHNMADFGPLMAKICCRVWGTPAKFNGFHVLPSLLQRRRSPEANQTLHDVWPSHYIYIFGGSCPWQNFARCKIHFKFTSKSCVLIYWQRYCMALQQRASAKLCGMVQGMELPFSQRVPPIFGRAAITFGISPHSSYCCNRCMSHTKQHRIHSTHLSVS